MTDDARTDYARYLLPLERDDDSRKAHVWADDSADTVCGLWRAGMVRRHSYESELSAELPDGVQLCRQCRRDMLRGRRRPGGPT